MIRMRDLLGMEGEHAMPASPDAGAGQPVHFDDLTQVGVDMESSLVQIAESQRTLASLERLESSLEAYADQPLTRTAAAFMHDSYTAAVAGMEGIAVMPALECFGPADPQLLHSASLESIGSAVRRAIEIVVGAIQRLVEMVQRVLEKVSPHLRMLSFQLYRIKLLARQINGRFPEVPSHTLGMRASMVSTEMRPVINGGELIKNLNELDTQFGIIAGAYQRNMTKIKDVYVEIMDHPPTEESKVHEARAKLASVIEAAGPTRIQSLLSQQKKLTDPRYPAGRATAAAPLPGQRSLVLVKPEGSAITEVVHQKIDLTRLNPSVVKNYSMVEMSTLMPQEVNEVLRLCEAIVDKLKSALHDGERWKVRQMADTVQKAQQSMEASYQGRQGEMAEIISAGATISGWISSPYLPMISLAVSVVSATLKLTGQHIRSYGVDEANA